MTPIDAAKLLDLSPEATSEQIESRFLDLRAKFEDKIAKAPTPGLKEKYRSSLEVVTAAYETLTLAADSSSLPVLRRNAPTASLTPAAASAPLPTAAPRPAQLSRTATVLIQITAFTKAGFAAGSLAGVLLVIGLMTSLINSDEDALPGIAVAGIAGLVVMPFVWNRSVRQAQVRLATGRTNTAHNILALVSLPFGLTIFGFLATGVAALLTEDRASAESTLLDQGPTLAEFEAKWNSALRIESDLKREIAAARLRSDSPSNQAEILALEEHARWWSTTPFIAESRLKRITAIRALLALARNPSAEAEKAYYTAWGNYGGALNYLPSEVDQDREKRKLPNRAVSLRAAEEANDPKAMVSLYIERGYEEAAAKAASLERLKKAALLGEVDAMILLGKTIENFDREGLHSHGSLEWWTQADAAGSPFALFGLARVYINEAGPLRDEEKGKELLQRAIDQLDRITP